LEQAGAKVERVKKITEGSPNIYDLIREGKIDFVVNTLTHGRTPFTDGFHIRRAAVELSVPCLTSLDTLTVMQKVIAEEQNMGKVQIKSLQEYVKTRE
jgi:carbamoyl-phosphate synthase large subunit